MIMSNYALRVMGDGKNGNVRAEMVDKRRRLKSMKVKNYGEFRPFESSSLYLHFHPFVSSQAIL